jgi:hypothetical protein
MGTNRGCETVHEMYEMKSSTHVGPCCDRLKIKAQDVDQSILNKGCEKREKIDFVNSNGVVLELYKYLEGKSDIVKAQVPVILLQVLFVLFRFDRGVTQTRWSIEQKLAKLKKEKKSRRARENEEKFMNDIFFFGL